LGNIRHWQPAETLQGSALTTSRRSLLQGRAGSFAAGKWGAGLEKAVLKQLFPDALNRHGIFLLSLPQEM
jgi:hypothetical protein